MDTWKQIIGNLRQARIGMQVWWNTGAAKIKKIFKIFSVVFVALETIVVTAALAVDTLRKWRGDADKSFPTVEPRPIEVAGNEIQVFTDGASLYTSMLEAIRSAKDHIFFEVFIWKGDELGQLFKDELIAAANRGVEVFCIYDVFANLVVRPSFKRFPQTRHLHILPFPLLRSFFLSMRNTGRDHRKLLVVDSKVGFVGGYNIGSLYAKEWRDTHLRLEGRAVWELDNAFRSFWNDHKFSRHPELPRRGTPIWQSRIKAALNTPNKLLFPVRGLYLEALDQARERVWITQAYFIPDRDILSGLVRAARRGVDVKVLIPATSNHVAADWVARSYYTELLESGVELWLYKGTMVHAKTATVDGHWTTIGTANIDRLSLTGNYEINIEVYSKELAEHMEKVFTADLTLARQLTLARWDVRGLLPRFTERVLRPLGPLL